MIYTIQNEFLTAQIDSLGAQHISLTDQNGTEYIWQRGPEWEDCAPILFPVVGRPLNNTITVDGKDYPMEIHGFAAQSEFRVTELTKSSVTFRLEDNEKTHQQYPYAFCFDVIYTLEGETLTTTLRTENRSDETMYFGVGGHLGLRCPIAKGEVFSDYELDFGAPVTLDTTCIDEETIMISSALSRRILTDTQKLPLSRDLFVPDALIFEKPSFDAVSLRSTKSGVGVHFAFSGFTTFAFWTVAPPENGEFLCFEPWNSMGMRTGEGTDLKAKKDILSLAPDQEFICQYRVTPFEKE